MTTQLDKGAPTAPPADGWSALAAWLVEVQRRRDAMDAKGGTE